MRTLIFALLALAGCASEWKCPKAPIVVAKFSVGEQVAFTKFITIWSAKSNPQTFWVDKGDTGVIVAINYFGEPPDMVQYDIELDKAKSNERLLVTVREWASAGPANTIHWIEAVVYPDGALKP